MTVIVMVIAAAATLVIAFFPHLPGRIGIAAALAHGYALVLYFLPALTVGGDYSQGVAMMLFSGMFIPYLVPAVISAVLVLSLPSTRLPTDA